MSTATVYYGVWINWNHGRVVGATITLPQRSGSLLTAFLAIFVATAGVAFWRILAFVIHQLRASQDPQDGLHHQQQAILRNTGTPGAASWQLLLLLKAWRKLAKRPFLRSLPIVLLAMTNLVIFGVASVFSAEVAKAAGTTVLVNGNSCGEFAVNSLSSGAAFTYKTLSDTITAASHARACYGGAPDALSCNKYVKPSLAYTKKRNDTCPFASGMCLPSHMAAFSLDTGHLSSHDDLGVNAQRKDRITYRRKTTCAPLREKDYYTTINYTDALHAYQGRFRGKPGDVIDFFDYGHITAFGGSNFTYYYNRHTAVDVNGYTLSSVDYGSGDGPNNTWFPVLAVSRDDADVSLIFLAANDILYTGLINDPIFQATKAAGTYDESGNNQTLYTSDYYVNALGCIDQHQFCNPNNDVCTDLNSYSTAVRSAWADLRLNSVQYMLVEVLSRDLWQGIISRSIGGRGSSALRAQESLNEQLFSAPLPDDQWMIEVESWFTTGLAKLQQYMVQFATGQSIVIKGAHVNTPRPDDQQTLCKSQKIQATHNATSFSILGIVIITVCGGFLILTNYSLDTVVGLIQRRWTSHQHGRLQWAIEDKLQLQRLAYEEAGMGTWSGGTSTVPVTRAGEKFGMPSDADPHHPRLRPYSVDELGLKRERPSTSSLEDRRQDGANPSSAGSEH